jgi:hypothetical protein
VLLALETVAPPRQTRVERLAMPLARDVVRDLAAEHGGCTRERDEAIAAGMGKLLKQARRKKAGEATGTQRPGPASKHPDEDRQLDDHDPDLGCSGGVGDRYCPRRLGS